VARRSADSSLSAQGTASEYLGLGMSIGLLTTFVANMFLLRSQVKEMHARGPPFRQEPARRATDALCRPPSLHLDASPRSLRSWPSRWAARSSP
jgi:hypothetical protein